MGSSTSTQRPALTRHHYALDALFAVALLIVVWAQMWVPRALMMGGGGPGGPRMMMGFGRPESAPLEAFLLVAVCILPLALRRRWPLAVLAVVSVATTLYQSIGYPASIVQVGVLVALYTAGTMVDRGRFALWAAVCAAPVVATALPVWGAAVFWADLVRTFAVLAVAAVVGDATRNRRAYIAEVERRAVEAERTREEEAARRVDEERLRIARELHDITAHSLSIVAVQSGAALHVLDTDPAAARGALEAIRATSRDALHELRSILGALRASGDAPEGAPLAPAPGLARISELAGPLRDAGLRVEIEGADDGEMLPAFVDTSAFRIVQEALTNVLRHAGKASVRVDIRREDDALAIEIVDDGAGAAPLAAAAEGHGTAGMRERALALGGTFDSGPAPGGGWRVAARLPLSGRGQQ